MVDSITGDKMIKSNNITYEFTSRIRSFTESFEILKAVQPWLYWYSQAHVQWVKNRVTWKRRRYS